MNPLPLSLPSTQDHEREPSNVDIEPVEEPHNWVALEGLLLDCRIQDP